MAARRTGLRDTELRRLRERGLRRDRRIARLRRRANLRRLRLLGICGLCILGGGVLGIGLGRYGLETSGAGTPVAMTLPAEAVDRVGVGLPSAPVTSDASPMPLNVGSEPAEPPVPDSMPVQETAAGPVSEAMLARLYEEQLEDSVTVPEPLGMAPETPNYALPFADLRDSEGPPAWQRHAVPVAASGARPMIAVVLDDLGLNRRGTRRAIALPGPLTLSFMTYAEALEDMTAAARKAGHELMLHVPMEPQGRGYDPGPNVLKDSLSPAELRARLDWGLARFDGFVGVNNHMGSRFSASAEGMSVVMRTLRARGLLFLDSVTSPASVGAAVATRFGVPFARRDIFLDNAWDDRAAIARQLARAERLARARGYAVAIGHPHRATLDVLESWLPEARRRGIELVPISAIVRQRFGIARHAARPAG